jgi:ribosome biogenesis GTPase
MTLLPGADAPRELIALGWDARHAAAWAELPAVDQAGSSLAPRVQPGRVLAEERGSLSVALATGEAVATLSGRLRHLTEIDPEALYPAVGDWVAVATDGGAGIIHGVLPRRSAIVRRGPVDRSMPTQVLASNVDVAFLVTSLNADFNLRRLERYVAVAWDSGATPVVLLSKADLAADAEGMRLAAEASAPGVDVIAVSAVTGQGIDAVRAHLGLGRTVVFLGSSGVGKSSLVNALAGEAILATASIREDDARGRHTTTRRQLVRLRDGLVIDTPGLRELALADGDGLADAFGDVETIASGCRFNDCRHQSEPGCAVRAALADGSLDRERFGAYRKLEREAHRAELATNAVARKAERRRWTAMIKGVERHMELKYGAER